MEWRGGRGHESTTRRTWLVERGRDVTGPIHSQLSSKAGKALKILLIAYEFPPGPSPQSLRWARFARELCALGDEVHVLTVARGQEPGRLDVPDGVRVYRIGTGLVSGAVDAIRRWSGKSRFPAPGAAVGAVAGTGPGGAVRADGMRGDRGGDVDRGPAGSMPGGNVPVESLNWKGRVVVFLDRLVVAVLGRMLGTGWISSESLWGFLARGPLSRLLDVLDPDVVISSHEPDATLRLGLMAKEKGYPWLADLGDPVLSGYTPLRRRRKAIELERGTCRSADHLTVTTEATRELLVSRHGVEMSRISVLPQGYDPPGPSPAGATCPVAFDRGLLELVYTGSFYSFRNPQRLVEAVLGREDTRLTVATRIPPGWLVEAAREWPARIRLTGFLSHDQALALQRSADVLVNIANDDPVQLPGKLFEYLGAGRPILHVGGARGLEFLLCEGCRGIAVANDVSEIGRALDRLAAIKRADAWHHEFDLDAGRFAGYEWRNIAGHLREQLVRLAGAASAG